MNSNLAKLDKVINYLRQLLCFFAVFSSLSLEAKKASSNALRGNTRKQVVKQNPLKEKTKVGKTQGKVFGEKTSFSKKESLIYGNDVFSVFEPEYKHPKEFEAKTLKEALVFTYENSYLLKAARSEMSSSFGNVLKAYGSLVPKISASAEVGIRRAEGISNTDSKLGVQAEYSLYNGNSTSNGIKAAKAKQRAATYSYRDKESDTFKNVIESFIEVVIANEILKINSQAIDYNKKLFAFVSAQMRLGVKTRADVKATEARLAKANAEFFRATAQREAASAKFRSIASCDVSMDAKMDEFIPMLFSLLPKSLPELIACAMKENAKINMAREEAKSVRLNYIISKASLGPTVNLTAGYSIGRPTRVPNPEDSRDIKEELRDELAAGVQMRFPIVDPNLWGNYTTVRHRDRAANHNLYHTVSSVKSSCIRFWQEILALRKSADASKSEILASSISLENYRQSFELGIASTTDVLKAEGEYYNAKKGFFDNRFKLMSALLGALYTSNRLTPGLLRLKVVEQVPVHLRAEDLKNNLVKGVL